MIQFHAAEEKLALHCQLGLAITEWASVEDKLALVLCSATKDPVALLLGFFSIENFRSKLKHTDTILKFKLKKNAPARGRWSELYVRLEKASAKRNRIAHSLLWEDTEQKIGKRYALTEWLASHQAGRAKRPQMKGALYVQDLAGIRADFSELAHHLAGLCPVIVDDTLPLPPLTSSAQQSRLPTIRTISAQIHAALGPPPKSSRQKS